MLEDDDSLPGPMHVFLSPWDLGRDRLSFGRDDLDRSLLDWCWSCCQLVIPRRSEAQKRRVSRVLYACMLDWYRSRVASRLEQLSADFAYPGRVSPLADPELWVGSGHSEARRAANGEHRMRQLVRQAVRTAGHGEPGHCPRWSAVGNVFGLGSGSATKLCRELGFDPDEEMGDPGDEEDGDVD